MTISCSKISRNLSFPPPCFLAKARMEVVGNPDEAMIRPPTKTFGGDNSIITPKQTKPTLFSFGILPFLVGGLTDSLNPCALTTIVFFVIVLHFFINHRKVMVVFGGSFILGVLGTIFFLTMGLGDPVRSSPLFFLMCRIIYLVIALIALGLGVVNLREWWIYKRTKSMDSFGMKFPMISKKFDQILHKISPDWKNALWFSLVCVAAGILSAFVMSIYPEQTYISMTVYALNVQQQPMISILSLFLYSLCFVFPLVFLLVFVILSLRLNNFSTITQRYRAAIKIICAAVLIAVGVGLIYAFL